MAALPPKAKPQDIVAIFKAFQQANPHPRTELLYHTPYQLLVAVVLSAQATDRGVNLATEPLFKKVKTSADMLAFGEPALLEAIKSIGLFRTKAKNVMALSAQLEQQHGGNVPRTREELEALPGVGRKTANVVLNQLYGQPTIAVDTHVFRVARRLGLSRGNTPEAVEADLHKVIPAEFQQHAHHWLILHGRYTCVARKPKCAVCPVAVYCHAPEKNVPDKKA